MIKKSKHTVLITSYIEPEYVEKLNQVDDKLEIIFEPTLIPAPRYAGDHTGHPFSRTPAQEKRWLDLLAEAEILFDFDKTHKKELPNLAPRVRWIQGTSTGIGEFVHNMEYDKRMPDTIFTVAGIHAQPLAEFCVMSLLMHFKRAHIMIEQKSKKCFNRYSGSDLENRTIAILGLGRNGSAIAKMARGIGMHVIGSDLLTKTDIVDEFFPISDLDSMLRQAEIFVITIPETSITKHLIDANKFSLFPDDAFFINISRGSIVDEAALITNLKNGKLSGAALDVFEKEPLPNESPLWDMANVILSPHAASISDHENMRLCQVFCDNLRLYLDGKPLKNLLNTELLY